KMVILFMDDYAYKELHQTRGQPWDRSWHADLLNKLADDGCALVVLDSFLLKERDSETDKKLAAALRRQRRVALAARQAVGQHPDLAAAQPELPIDLFLNASGTNWGVAWYAAELDDIVRRHWPF